MAEAFRCAVASADRDDPLFATASHVRRWVLLEQPGPWGRDAVLESRLPAVAATELKRRTRRLGARLLLLRRHGRGEPAPPRAFVASTAPRARWIEALTLRKGSDLLDADLSGLGEDESVGGVPVLDPLYLVCTHGRHDVCCAENGRPLAGALARAFGDRVWECSHIGGDRFAGNLLCLPDGLYFGRAGAEAGLRIATLYDQGLVDLDHYRGCSAYPFAVQAAEYYVRRRHRLERVAELRLERVEPLRDGAVRVSFSGRDDTCHSADIRVVEDGEPHRLTCGATLAVPAPRYELLDLQPGR